MATIYKDGEIVLKRFISNNEIHWGTVIMDRGHWKVSKAQPEQYRKLKAPWVFYIRFKRDQFISGKFIQYQRYDNYARIKIGRLFITIGLPWKKSYLINYFKQPIPFSFIDKVNTQTLQFYKNSILIGRSPVSETTKTKIGIKPKTIK